VDHARARSRAGKKRGKKQIGMDGKKKKEKKKRHENGEGMQIIGPEEKGKTSAFKKGPYRRGEEDKTNEYGGKKKRGKTKRFGKLPKGAMRTRQKLKYGKGGQKKEDQTSQLCGKTWVWEKRKTCRRAKKGKTSQFRVQEGG